MVNHWEQHVTETGTDYMVLQARANCSSSLSQLALVFAWLSAVTLLIAIYLAIQGFWPVLAFAIIHLLLVGWALRMAWRRNWRMLEVRIDPQHIRVLINQAGMLSESQLTTGWTRVVYHPGQPPARDNRVLLSCQGCCLELGQFLNCQERELLAQRLQSGLQRHSLLHTSLPSSTAAGSQLIA